MGLLDQIAAVEDVAEELVHIDKWDVDILFRGMSFASLSALRGVDMAAAAAGDLEQAITLVIATACDPETKELLFDSDHGREVLNSKNYEAVMQCLNDGTLIVLGVDEGETAGKDSSSTETDQTASA